MPDPPSLPAIRERVREWQQERAVAAALDWKWTGPPEVPGLQEDLAFLLSLIARLQGERETNQRALVTAYTRLEILLGRMRACHEESGAHAVTMIEVPGWLEEMRAALGEEAE